MKNFLTNKSLIGATKQYITLSEAVIGGGLRKEYLLRLVDGVLKADEDMMSDYFEHVIEALKVDARYNRNLLAFINNAVTYPTRAKARLEAVTEDSTMDGILTIGRSLKLSAEALEAKLTEAAEAAEVVEAEAVQPTAEEVEAEAIITESHEEAEAVQKERKQKVITTAGTIAKSSLEDIEDRLYGAIDRLEELVANIDTKNTPKETLAVLVAKLEAINL